ncbi:D-Ala-D-Ala carboxypeptidase family metallohydrolase [Rhizobium grahamii]|nr:D-Ala-D-Ala carboxypeptidase family metallohydrolase [Rhizobium grahamii]
MSEQDAIVEELEGRADAAEDAAYDEGIKALREGTADAAEMDSQFEEEFRVKVASWNLSHFHFREFLFLGGSHNAPGSACRGLNSLPQKPLWDHFEKTAKVLDQLRERLNAPIRLSSIYRNEAYNGCLSGTASESQHKQMRAADFTAAIGNPADWRHELIQMRSQRVFSGGIGIYNTFVHVDTRGVDRDWDFRS